MAAPKLDRAKAVRVLIDAAGMGDRKACALHKISDRTLRNYRARFENDAELAEAFQTKSDAIDRTWKVARRRALTSVIDKLEELVALAMPDQIRDVAMAAKILGELEITQEALGSTSTNQPGESAGEAEVDPRAAGAPSGSRQAGAVH